jgi:hypothetical protein
MDTEKFVSFFSEEGYMHDIPSGTKFRGKAMTTTCVNRVPGFAMGQRKAVPHRTERHFSA